MISIVLNEILIVYGYKIKYVKAIYNLFKIKNQNIFKKPIFLFY